MPSSPKKLLILAILEILRKYTDCDHGLLQSQIIERLERDYDLTATRKSVRANLTELEIAGYPIDYNNGWYYEHEFCSAELNLILDSLMYNPNIPYRQCRELMEKVRMLGGSRFRYVCGGSMKRPENAQYLYTLDMLHEAIESQKQISFHYGWYDIDKQLHLRRDANGTPHEYTASPYRVVFANGRGYLICNVSKYDDAAHFRIDRMADAAITDMRAKPANLVRGLEFGLNLPEYLLGHAHMFSGTPQLYRLHIKRDLAGDIMDWFGVDVQFDNISAEEADAWIRTDARSLKYWLKMYGEYAELSDQEPLK